MLGLFRAHFPFPLARKPDSPHPSLSPLSPPHRVTTDPGPLTHAAALVVKMAAPCVYCSKQQGRIREYFCEDPSFVGFYLRFSFESSILHFLFC